MIRKILDVLTIVSTILTLGIVGTGFFTYKYVTSAEFQRNLKNKLMSELQEKIEEQIPLTIPEMTSPAIPF
tara:strand:+ start:760 stop:972 length:213 start_codon:yes stop_codon:yes gene_type:complete